MRTACQLHRIPAEDSRILAETPSSELDHARTGWWPNSWPPVATLTCGRAHGFPGKPEIRKPKLVLRLSHTRISSLDKRPGLFDRAFGGPTTDHCASFGTECLVPPVSVAHWVCNHEPPKHFLLKVNTRQGSIQGPACFGRLTGTWGVYG